MENPLEMFEGFQLQRMSIEIRNEKGEKIGERTVFCLLKNRKIVLTLWDNVGLPGIIHGIITQIKGAEEFIGAAK